MEPIWRYFTPGSKERTHEEQCKVAAAQWPLYIKISVYVLERCHFIKSKPQKAFLDVPSLKWMLYQIIFPFSIFAEGNINNGLDTLFLCSTAKDPFDCLSADLVNKNSFFFFKVRENSISSFWLLIQFCYCEKNNEHTNKIMTL